jgi:UDP-N-acetylmuramoylalanine--D-glutamate ligase
MHTIIVGLGKTGASCLRYLAKRGVAVAATDSRAAPPALGALGELAGRLDLRLGGFDLSLLDGASQILMSPGVSLDEPIAAQARARGIEIAGDVELFARAARAPIVAVTGTNGKSTVTTLLARMAGADRRRVLAGGNLGPPALDLLEAPTPDLYVLELSSFQLETTRSLAPAAAVVLNVSADHMDRYASLADYARAKRRVYERAQVQVVNADDPVVAAMRRADVPALYFSTRDPAADFGLLRAGGAVHLARRGEPLLDLAALKISGLHNAANALAALSLGEAVGLGMHAMLEALVAFPGLPHRSEWVADRGDVRYIDDSKGTNVGATVAAVAGSLRPLVLIAGGEGKGQDFTPLAAALRGRVHTTILIGKDAPALARVLDGVCAIQHAATMPEAVERAARAALPGDAVLLSPACASLDMFRDYAHRGAEFAAAVRALPEHSA